MPKIYSLAEFGVLSDFRFFIQSTTLKRKHFERHGHAFSELVVVLGGAGLHVTEDETYPIAAGDVFVVNGSATHGFREIKQLQVCNIMYDPEQFTGNQQDLYDLPGYHALFILEPLYRRQHPGKLCLEPTGLSHVSVILSQLESEYAAKPPGYKTMITSHLLKLFVYLSRQYGEHHPAASEAVFRLAEVVSHMQKHYREPLELTELASQAHLSKSQFLRIFKRAFGTSPIDYLIRLRVYKACTLLQRSHLTISQVAVEVGFSESAYFTRQFRRVMQRSPSDFRYSALAFY